MVPRAWYAGADCTGRKGKMPKGATLSGERYTVPIYWGPSKSKFSTSITLLPPRLWGA